MERPLIQRFTAKPPVIEKGEAAVLRWNVLNVDEVTISGVGNAEPNGRREVFPVENTRYVLTATNGSCEVDTVTSTGETRH